MRTIYSKKHKTTKGRGELAFESKISQAFYRGISKFPFLPSLHRYSITISHGNKFIWYRIPKVATNTILDHLKEQGVYLDAEYAFQVNYPPRLYAPYYKFAFIRNPWERLISCWLNKVVLYNHFKFNKKNYDAFQNLGAFVSFVESLDIQNCDGHLKSQSSSIDLNQVDFIGRLDNFDTDFQVVCENVGISGHQVKIKNKNLDKADFRTYYNGNLKDKVFKIYEKDIRLFGYDF